TTGWSRVSERALAVALALTLVAQVLANGGGVILPPPADFTLVAPGSVTRLLEGVHVKHAVSAGGALWVATLDRGVAHRAAGAAGFTWLDRKSGALPADATARVARFRGDTWVGFAAGGV